MAGQLRLVIVTPEKTVLDETVAALHFPLYDGEIGILPGRLPMIGRLGSGLLHIRDLTGGERELFIDGGFVQIRDNQVTLLTDRCLPPSALSVTQAEQMLAAARARKAHGDQEIELRDREETRARAMLHAARKA